jgi:hypothetical protein
VEEEAQPSVNRRRLLRKAGAVVAGVGAAGVATAIAADPAAATVGDNVVAGQAVDAGGATTSISSASPTNPTLQLTNSTGPSLRLAPTTATLWGVTAPVGSLNASGGGAVLEYQSHTDFTAEVYTSARATQLWPVNPFRVLDTRNLGGYPAGYKGREYILNPSVLNSDGTLKARQTLLLNLTPFVNYGWAVMGNATLQAPQGDGFITVYPAGFPQPTASSVNFLKGWPVSNGVFVALGIIDDTYTDVIAIYSAVTTHVLFDVTGFLVSTVDNIVAQGVLPVAGAAPASATPAAKARADKVNSFNARKD